MELDLTSATTTPGGGCIKCACSHTPNYGACEMFEMGMNGRCVQCDHAIACHPGKGPFCNTPSGFRGMSRTLMAMAGKLTQCRPNTRQKVSRQERRAIFREMKKGKSLIEFVGRFSASEVLNIWNQWNREGKIVGLRAASRMVEAKNEASGKYPTKEFGSKAEYMAHILTLEIVSLLSPIGIMGFARDGSQHWLLNGQNDEHADDCLTAIDELENFGSIVRTKGADNACSWIVQAPKPSDGVTHNDKMFPANPGGPVEGLASPTPD